MNNRQLFCRSEITLRSTLSRLPPSPHWGAIGPSAADAWDDCRAWHVAGPSQLAPIDGLV